MVVVSERVKVNVDRMDGRRGSRVALRRRGGSGVQCVQCVCDVMCQWPGRGRDRVQGEGEGCAKMPSGEVRARGNKEVRTAREGRGEVAA